MFNLYTTKNNLFYFHHQKNGRCGVMIHDVLDDVEDDGGAVRCNVDVGAGVCEVRN